MTEADRDNAQGACPILLVRDVVASAEYWRERVGFTYDKIYGQPAAFVILTRGRTQIMLARAPEGHEIVPHWRVLDGMWNVYIYVEDAEAMFAEMKERGATIDYEIGDKPYGCREFGIQDLDGHDIAFGQVLDDDEDGMGGVGGTGGGTGVGSGEEGAG